VLGRCTEGILWSGPCLLKTASIAYSCHRLQKYFENLQKFFDYSLQNFDFNKWIYKGIPFTPIHECQKRRKELVRRCIRTRNLFLMMPAFDFLIVGCFLLNLADVCFFAG
jgi:hypothetical protein